MGSTPYAVSPIALGQDEGEALRSFGQLIVVKASSETTDGRVAVFDTLGPRGSGSPLHVHRREDEWFYVLEGDLTFWVGGRVINAPAGAFVYGPRDIAHTFIVASEQAHFLLVTEPGGFDAFVRAAGQPAERLEIPPVPTEPPDITGPTTLAATFGIENPRPTRHPHLNHGRRDQPRRSKNSPLSAHHVALEDAKGRDG